MNAFAGYQWLGLPFEVFGATALLSVAALCWAYWKRRKSHHLIVSHLAFWQPASARNALWRRPLANTPWLWWLAATAIAMALFAAMELIPTPTPVRGRHVILALDEAAMRSTTGAAQIMARAREIVTQLEPADRVCVLGFDDHPRLLLAWQHDPNAVLQWFANWAATPAPQPKPHDELVARRNLALALAYAHELTRGRARPRVVVVGPGGYEKALPHRALEVVWAPAATGLRNVGLSSFAVSRLRSQDDVTATFRVHNHNALAATVRIAINDSLYNATMELKAFEERAITTTLQTEAVVPFRLRLYAAAQQNEFIEDDEAIVLLPTPPPTQVVVVGPRNRYLEAALAALPRRVETSFVDALAWQENLVGALVIFNEVVPAQPPTRGSFVYFVHAEKDNRAASPWPLSAVLETPTLTVPSHTPAQQALLQHLNLSALNLKRATALKLPPGAQALANHLRHTVVGVKQTTSLSELVFGFSLRQSDFVWRPEFPLLLENVLDRFVPPVPTSAHVRLNSPHPAVLNGSQFFVGEASPSSLWHAPNTTQHRWLAAAQRRTALVGLTLALLCGLVLVLAQMQRGLRGGVALSLQACAMIALVAALTNAKMPSTWFGLNVTNRPVPSKLQTPSGQVRDVALDRMVVPAVVSPHETFRFRLPVQASEPGVVTIEVAPPTVALDPAVSTHATQLAPGHFQVSVTPGTTWVHFTNQSEAAPGQPLLARLVGVPAATNEITQNDVSYAHPVVRQAPSILIVTPGPAQVGSFAQALRAQGFDVAVHTPSRAPEPSGFDLVVLADLPRNLVKNPWLQQLAHAVDLGTGLLVAGGPAAFGGGGWADSALAALLPVTLEVPAQRPKADLAVALVVDRSGSMGGAKIDLTREAVRATSFALRPSDLLTVIAFDSRAETIVPLQAAANRPRIWAQMERLSAGGGTNLTPALAEAYQVLLGSPAQRRHIILLSDGHTPSTQLSELLDQITAAQITISAVAVGRGADVGLLRRLADAGGGRLHVTDDPSRIPRIFTSDVAQAEPRSWPQQPRRVRSRGHQLGELDFTKAPALPDVTVFHARKDAQLVLETNRGEPLLVSWHVGAGQVAAFAADLSGPWLAAWTRWPQYPKLWASVTRGLLRGNPGHTSNIQVRALPRGLLAEFSATTDNGDPYTGLKGSLQLQPPTDQQANPTTTWQTALRETNPGQYAAWLPTNAPFSAPPSAATITAQLVDARESDPFHWGTGHVAWPYPWAFAPGATGAQAFNFNVTSGATELPLGPWLSGLAALLFVAALLAPRATFRPSKTKNFGA